MPEKFPLDELDAVTAIGGRHRRPASFGSRLWLAGRLIGTSAIIAFVGFLALNGVSNLSLFTGSTSTQKQTLAGFKENGASVTIIDATGSLTAGSSLASKLADENWNVISAVYQDTSPDAVTGASNEIATTIVYANAAQSLGAAHALASNLGNYKVKQAATYPDAVTVVLGKDFK